MASSPRSSVLVIGRPDFCSPGLEEPSDSFSFSCSDSLEEARSAIESRAYGLTLIDPSLPGVKEGSALDEITRQAPGSIRMLLDRSLSVGAFAQKLRAFLGEKPEPIEPNAKLSALIESSEDAIFTKSLDGIIQSWNPGAQRMYGYSPDEIIGRSVEILMPQERKGEAREILAKIKSGERVRHYESRRLRKDGSTFDVSLSISPIRDSVGAIIEACTIARDISERTQAEDQRLRHQRELEQEFERKTAELRDEKDFVESLFESLPGIISIRSSDGRLLKWNKEYEEVTGFSGEELVRLNAEALAQIPEAASVRAVHQKTQEVGRSVVEALIRTKDKRLIPYGFISVRGRYAGIDANISMGIDISEASRVTERLREENAFSESLIQNMPGVLIIRDFDFKLLKWNKNLETVTGYSGEELQSLDNRVLADPVSSDGVEDMIRSLSEGNSLALDAVFRTKDGGRVPFFIHSVKIDYFGKAAILSIGFDISAQKRAMAALRFGEQKTRLLGEVAAAANAAVSARDVLSVALKAIASHLGYAVGQAYLAEKDMAGATSLKASDIWYSADLSRFADFRAAFEAAAIAPGEGLARSAIASREPMVMEDLSGNADDFQIPLAAGMRSAACFPVIAYNDVVAVLGFFAIEPRGYADASSDLVELVIAQVRTAMERLAAEERLRRLSTVVEQSPIGVLIADPAGGIIYANPGLARMSSYSQNEITENRPESHRIIEAESQRRYTEAKTAALAGEAWKGEVLVPRKDGSFFWGRMTLVPIKDPTGRVESTVALFEDISDAKKVEEDLREKEASARLARTMAVAANSATNIESILAEALRSIAEYASWPLGHVYLTRRSDDHSVTLASSDIWHQSGPGDFEEFKRITAETVLPGESVIREAFNMGQIGWLDDEEENERFIRKPSAVEAGLVSASFLPVFVGDAVFAVLEFFSTEPIQQSAPLLEHINQVLLPLQVALTRLTTEEKILKLSEIIEQGPSGVATLDGAGAIDYSNKRFHDITGYDVSDLIGKNADFLGKDLEDREMVDKINEVVISGQVWKGDLYNKRKDGSRFWERTSIFPVLDEKDHLLSVVMTIDDITELKGIEAELVQAKVEAERANRAKSDFLAKMSHEIRTPMNAVIGLTGLALKTDLNPKQADYLRKIQLSSNVLLDLINDILDFSKIEAGKIEIERVPFDLEQLIQNLCSLVSLRAAEKGLELAVSVPADLPARLVGDPHRLNQVLLNLLNNAVKFTERGEVVLVISIPFRSAHRIELNFSVKDSGIGINEAKLGRLFQPFSQADSQIARTYGGTGLGLAISKQLVELMGGSLSVSSEEGKGSDFNFKLPFALVGKSGSPLAMVAGLRGINILIVEDNATAASILESELGFLGLSSSIVHSEPEALATVATMTPSAAIDLFLVDTKLGEEDGVETVRRLRAGETGKRSVVILMGSDSERDSALQRAASLEVAAFLAKPVNTSNLMDALMNAFAKGPARAPDETAPIANRRWKALRGASVLLAEDNEINQQVARELLESVGIEVEMAWNGLEAIEMLKARRYDAVLMDIQMPEMDGITATRIIRSDADLRNCVVIAMTADVFSVNSEEFREAGMDDSVFKPIDENQLFATLEKWVRMTRNRSKVIGERKPEPSQGNDFEIPKIVGLDVEGGLARVLGNKELYRRILFKFLDDEEGAVVRICEAVSAGDVALAKTLSHGLKGIAGNIGAVRLYEKLVRFEGCLKAADLAGAGSSGALALDAGRELFDSIRSWRETEAARAADKSSDRVVAGNFDPEGALALVDELRSRIALSDTEAANTFAALRLLLSGAGREMELDALDARLGAYDFAGAASALAELETSLRERPEEQ